MNPGGNTGLRYAVALGAAAAAIGLRLLLDPWLADRLPFITVFGAVIVAAWYGGFGPALAAAAAGYLAAHYVFIPDTPVHPAELALYALSALLIAALGGAMRRAAARAAASDERFRKFMENSPASVFIKDAGGRYVFMNAAGERLVGTKDWCGRTDAELLAADLARQVQENDRRVLEAGAPLSFALTLPQADGARHLHSTKFPLREADGRLLVGSLTVDVTQQALAMEELRVVADTMPVGVVRCSREMKYIWVNRVFAAWVGRAPEELAGTAVEARLGAEEMRITRPYFERVLRGERVEYERLASFPRLGQRCPRAGPTWHPPPRPSWPR